ncbi:CheR family methyltransferase [Sulfuricurvum sp.]|uniref:CheR family methyltransferase n=1 Tax=Sulfuricurvum sp. TaxID=2025608 RepID=UPI003BB5417C
MTNPPITLTDNEFALIQKIIFDEAGITLDESKKSMVQNRLFKRMAHYKFTKFNDYIRVVQFNRDERIEMINQLTTNETYFFREMLHFDFLASIASKHRSPEPFSVWSAAASVGAEAYSSAMLLDSILGSNGYQIIGTDINTEVLNKARIGLYPEVWVDKIPPELRSKSCLKGKGTYAHQFLIHPNIIEKVTFKEGNLLKEQQELGKFDIIFLRNVLIYFNDATREIVVRNTIKNLKVGGFLIISLTESIKHLPIEQLTYIENSIYRKETE